MQRGGFARLPTQVETPARSIPDVEATFVGQAGTPGGIQTLTQLSQLIDPDWGAERIGNLYASFQGQLRDILRRLGLRSVQALRGRKDLLVYGKEDA